MITLWNMSADKNRFSSADKKRFRQSLNSNKNHLTSDEHDLLPDYFRLFPATAQWKKLTTAKKNKLLRNGNKRRKHKRLRAWDSKHKSHKAIKAHDNTHWQLANMEDRLSAYINLSELPIWIHAISKLLKFNKTFALRSSFKICLNFYYNASFSAYTMK